MNRNLLTLTRESQSEFGKLVSAVSVGKWEGDEKRVPWVEAKEVVLD